MRVQGIIVFLAGALLLWGSENLEITADKFTHVEKEHKAIFEGHARATQGASWIRARKFIVYFDADNNAKEYRALGGVNFEIIKRPNRDIKGHCDKLIYNVKADNYSLIGHAIVNDRINKRIMKGAKIFLDNRRGLATATSGKRGPVKFVFPIKEIGGSKKR